MQAAVGCYFTAAITFNSIAIGVGKAVGVLEGTPPEKGRHFDPHSLAVDKDNSLFTAEVTPWRVQKFRMK